MTVGLFTIKNWYLHLIFTHVLYIVEESISLSVLQALAKKIMYRWATVGALSPFIYIIATVIVIVSGQPTTDDDGDNELIDLMATIQAELTKLVAENNVLKAKVAKLEAEQPGRLDNCKSLCFVSYSSTLLNYRKMLSLLDQKTA